MKATALRVTKGTRNDYEQAVKLQDWFAEDGGFRYDVDVESGTGVQAISRFLKDKEGFCVHFSFSMAAMARSLGIPARVAVGFMPGTTQTDGSLSVGIRDAHAWPELYFEGAGWTRFEPTPSRGSTPTYTRADTPSGTATGPAQPQQSASAQPSAAPSASESCTPQERRLGDCGPEKEVGAAASDGSGPDPLTVVLLTLGALVLLSLPLLPLLWRTRVRARRLGSAGVRGPEETAARTLAVWREINDTAWDYGVEPDESRTPRKSAARIVRLGELGGEAADAVHRVARAVEEALYAPHPRPPRPGGGGGPGPGGLPRLGRPSHPSPRDPGAPLGGARPLGAVGTLVGDDDELVAQAAGAAVPGDAPVPQNTPRIGLTSGEGRPVRSSPPASARAAPDGTGPGDGPTGRVPTCVTRRRAAGAPADTTEPRGAPAPSRGPHGARSHKRVRGLRSGGRQWPPPCCSSRRRCHRSSIRFIMERRCRV